MTTKAESQINEMRVTVGILDATVTEWIKGHDKHSSQVVGGFNKRVDACDKSNVEIFQRLKNIDVAIGKISEKLDSKPCPDHSDAINGVYDYVNRENSNLEDRVDTDIDNKIKSVKIWVLVGVVMALFSVVMVFIQEKAKAPTPIKIEKKISTNSIRTHSTLADNHSK